MRWAATPQLSRCAPTPGEVTNGTLLLAGFADGRVVEVVVVIVEITTRSSGGNRDSATGTGWKPSAPPAARASSVTPHRVGEYAPPVDLDQRRRMPQPGDPQAAGCAACPGLKRAHRRQLCCGARCSPPQMNSFRLGIGTARIAQRARGAGSRSARPPSAGMRACAPAARPLAACPETSSRRCAERARGGCRVQAVRCHQFLSPARAYAPS